MFVVKAFILRIIGLIQYKEDCVGDHESCNYDVIIHRNLFQVPPGRVLPGAGGDQPEAGPCTHVSLQQVGRGRKTLQPSRASCGAQQSLIHQHHQPLRINFLLRLPRYNIWSDAKRSHGELDALSPPRPHPVQGGWRGQRLPASSVTSLCFIWLNLVTCVTMLLCGPGNLCYYVPVILCKLSTDLVPLQ